MKEIPVSLKGRPYNIMLGTDVLAQAGALLAPYARNNRLIIVTDDNAGQHIGPAFTASLDAAGISAMFITLPAGEATKSWTHLASLCDQLLALGIERSDHIVALGGGVIGDLVGFAASILKRGCGFIQVPTTLLAQVDSSVGGKTAINTAAGKNLIGQFHQPAMVLIDPVVLDTLPQRELRAGYAEIVKYGLINNAAFFDWCEANAALLLSGDREAQLHAIEVSVRTKAEIVAADERETDDIRALLNLGHTFGHALEADKGFSSALLHGEGVAAGMALAFGYSARTGRCDAAVAGRVAAHLASLGLPHDLASAGVAANGQALVNHMLHDKKMAGGTLPFILARGIGGAYVDRDVVLDDVAAYLDER
jgi:3-dehydroquinate synthase